MLNAVAGTSLLCCRSINLPLAFAFFCAYIRVQLVNKSIYCYTYAVFTISQLMKIKCCFKATLVVIPLLTTRWQDIPWTFMFHPLGYDITKCTSRGTKTYYNTQLCQELFFKFFLIYSAGFPIKESSWKCNLSKLQAPDWPESDVPDELWEQPLQTRSV